MGKNILLLFSQASAYYTVDFGKINRKKKKSQNLQFRNISKFRKFFPKPQAVVL